MAAIPSRGREELIHWGLLTIINAYINIYASLNWVISWVLFSAKPSLVLLGQSSFYTNWFLFCLTKQSTGHHTGHHDGWFAFCGEESSDWLLIVLTHLPLDKMASILKTTFSIAFSWMKMFEFLLKFHWTVWYKTKFGSQNFGYQLWCLFCNICIFFKNMFNVPLIIMW